MEERIYNGPVVCLMCGDTHQCAEHRVPESSLVPELVQLRELVTRFRAENEALRSRSYTYFFNEVCKRAEANMLKTGKLEGAHYAAMVAIKREWDAALAAGRGE
jgi:hypothetical protein